LFYALRGAIYQFVRFNRDGRLIARRGDMLLLGDENIMIFAL
jgi:hypothetical protein